MSLLGHVSDPVHTHGMFKFGATIQCGLAQYAINFNLLYLAPVINVVYQILIGFVSLPDFQTIVFLQLAWGSNNLVGLILTHCILPLDCCCELVAIEPKFQTRLASC